MSNDDDMLAEFDLSAWDAPPPPVDLADAVIDRMGGTDVGIAVPVEERGPRRGWIIAGVAAAVIVLGLGVWSLLRATHHAAPASGGVVAEKARSLSLDTVHADLDAGADVRWHRDGGVLRVEQRAGNVTWHVDGGEKLVIDAGAASASVEATGANLRVEVQMNSMDARVIGASALTAAAVAMVTVVVYEGHVKVGKPNQQTVVVAPGTTYKVNDVDDDPGKLVGSAPIARGKIAVLGLELVGDGGPDAPVVTQVLGASMRAIAGREGPYALVPGSDKELVDVKLLFNCATEASPCMAAIGADLGADLLVYGHVQQSKDHYGVSLKLFDVARAQITRSTSEVFPASEAEGEQLDVRARKLYLELVGGVATACDADALKEQGMENINMGQHAAALAKFEASLACKPDAYVTQLAFMEACASQSSEKAKVYYKQLTKAQQAKFAQICIRNKVEYQDDVDTASAGSCKGVDEVSCVLTNYEGDCCTKYKKGYVASANDSLTRADISAAIAAVKPKITACGEQPNPGGKLVARVVVRPNGSVSSVAVTTSPDDRLTACVKRVLEDAAFKQTANGGSFSYPFIFSAKTASQAASCDATKLKEEGMQNINMGQHAAALAKFEASLRCKSDAYVTQLAFMSSCASRNAPKAQLYFKQLTISQQEKFAQMCIREKVAFVKDEGYLEVLSSGGPARIFVDGKDTGLKTPVRGTKLKLRAGTHKVTYLVDGKRYTYSVDIKEGEIGLLDKELD